MQVLCKQGRSDDGCLKAAPSPCNAMQALLGAPEGWITNIQLAKRLISILGS